MSESGGGPIRRRRIAGEPKPAAPAKKAVARKPASKKVPAKKVAPSTSSALKAPTSKTPASSPAKKDAAGKTAAESAPIASPVADQPAATTPAAPAAEAAAARRAAAQQTAERRTAARKVAAARASTTAAPPARKPVRPAKPATPAESGARVGGPTRRDAVWLIPAAIIAVAALVLGGFTVFKGVSDVGGGNSSNLTSAQRQASSAAGAAAETIFSYRFDKLPQHLTDSKALMTSKFGKDFDKIAPALNDVAPQRRVQVQAVSRGAAALSCGDECSANKVNVLVFLDQARLIDGSKQPDVIGNRITVSMVKRNGTWLVDDIRAL